MVLPLACCVCSAIQSSLIGAIFRRSVAPRRGAKHRASARSVDVHLLLRKESLLRTITHVIALKTRACSPGLLHLPNHLAIC
jgi:hypothetical protein